MKKNPKIVSIAKLAEICEKLRKQKKVIVSTNGFYDILHVGHVWNLQNAKSLGDVLIVGVNTDDQATLQKGPGRPVFPLSVRMETIAALQSVDYVFSFSTPKPHPWLKRLKPDIHTKGGDRGRRISDQDVVEAYGGKVVFTKVYEGRGGEKYATTATIEKIKKL